MNVRVNVEEKNKDKGEWERGRKKRYVKQSNEKHEVEHDEKEGTSSSLGRNGAKALQAAGSKLGVEADVCRDMMDGHDGGAPSRSNL